MYDIRFLFYSRWFTCLFGQHTPMLIWGSNCAAKAVLEVPEAAEQDESEKWALNAPRESESCLNRILAEVLMLGTLGNVCFSSLKIFVFHLYITWLEKLLATSVCLGVGSAPRTLKGGKIMLQLIWFRDNGAFLKVPPSAAGIKSSKKNHVVSSVWFYPARWCQSTMTTTWVSKPLQFERNVQQYTARFFRSKPTPSTCCKCGCWWGPLAGTYVVSFLKEICPIPHGPCFAQHAAMRLRQKQLRSRRLRWLPSTAKPSLRMQWALLAWAPAMLLVLVFGNIGQHKVPSDHFLKSGP